MKQVAPVKPVKGHEKSAFISQIGHNFLYFFDS